MRNESYLETARREFRRLRKLADAALAQLDDRELVLPVGAGDVSAALLMKHLVGPRWRTLSVTKGESRAYNESPRPYLTDDV
jgi:hypothetical protein